MNARDKATVGLSAPVHAMCKRLQEVGIFTELRDAYRFGIALAMARGKAAAEVSRPATMFDVGGMDPDGTIRDAIREMYPEERDRPYAFAERLAEYGVEVLGQLHDARTLRFEDLIREVMGDQAGVAS